MPPVRLYIDDLQAVLDAVAIDADIELHHGDFVYDSIADLQKHLTVDFLDALSVEVSKRNAGWASIDIKIRPFGVDVSGRGDMKDKAASCAHHLAKKSPWYSWYPRSHQLLWDMAIVGLMGGVMCLAFWYCFYLTPDWGPALSYSVFGSALLPYFAILFSRHSIFLGTSRIYLSTRSSRRSFWQRHKDDILKEAIKYLVAAALGFALARITGSGPHP